MTWPTPRSVDRHALPDGLCCCAPCTSTSQPLRRAPSIEECVADRTLAEQLRALHQVWTERHLAELAASIVVDVPAGVVIVDE